MDNLIALVDINDKVIGFDDKLEVHRKGLLHRAFSIIVVNSKKELLLQRRALSKYHSPGLWTNTCCSHQPKGFEMEPYAHQRLAEEMGFDCGFQFVNSFHYRIDFKDGMIENEIDHIYFGVFDGNPKPNPAEVSDWKWIGVDDVKKDLLENPTIYTYWFRFIIENHFDIFEKLP